MYTSLGGSVGGVLVIGGLTDTTDHWFLHDGKKADGGSVRNLPAAESP